MRVARYGSTSCGRRSAPLWHSESHWQVIALQTTELERGDGAACLGTAAQDSNQQACRSFHALCTSALASRARSWQRSSLPCSAADLFKEVLEPHPLHIYTRMVSRVQYTMTAQLSLLQTCAHHETRHLSHMPTGGRIHHEAHQHVAIHITATEGTCPATQRDFVLGASDHTRRGCGPAGTPATPRQQTHRK